MSRERGDAGQLRGGRGGAAGAPGTGSAGGRGPGLGRGRDAARRPRGWGRRRAVGSAAGSGPLRPGAPEAAGPTGYPVSCKFGTGLLWKIDQVT